MTGLSWTDVVSWQQASERWSACAVLDAASRIFRADATRLQQSVLQRVACMPQPLKLPCSSCNKQQLECRVHDTITRAFKPTSCLWSSTPSRCLSLTISAVPSPPPPHSHLLSFWSGPSSICGPCCMVGTSIDAAAARAMKQQNEQSCVNFL